jgi:hypothetical protein
VQCDVGEQAKDSEYWWERKRALELGRSESMSINMNINMLME